MPQETTVPDMSIRVNGREIPQAAQQDVMSTAVHEDLNAASMFTIHLYNWDMAKRQYTWSDDALFAPGNELEIWMGYEDQLKKIMVGEITSLEPQFQADEAPSVIVRGLDHRHRLFRGHKTRSFTKIKDSAIAQQIAQQAGLRAKTIDSKVTQEYILQHNQTDMLFLQERAARIGYEVFVKEKTLYFQPHQHDGRETITLSLEQDVIEFYPRLTTVSQIGELVVQGWDPKQKKAILGKAAVGQESSIMGGHISGPKAARRAFGESRAAMVAYPVSSKAEADQMALGQFNEIALTYITGDGLCLGRNDLRAGMVVKIEGAGTRFSGLYYVTTTEHSVTPTHGYQTRFTVQRNAS